MSRRSALVPALFVAICLGAFLLAVTVYGIATRSDGEPVCCGPCAQGHVR